MAVLTQTVMVWCPCAVAPYTVYTAGPVLMNPNDPADEVTLYTSDLDSKLTSLGKMV